MTNYRNNLAIGCSCSGHRGARTNFNALHHIWPRQSRHWLRVSLSVKRPRVQAIAPGWVPVSSNGLFDDNAARQSQDRRRCGTRSSRRGSKPVECRILCSVFCISFLFQISVSDFCFSIPINVTDKLACPHSRVTPRQDGFRATSWQMHGLSACALPPGRRVRCLANARLGLSG